ncbi:pyocin knob domain-containing protein [Aeromonas enteropelogenes]|uniref:pyocin knob domain-containing protein n=1 Tax=Aeromonas enteropelogenes TaxID=29489 RepID=UPI003BA1C022
MPNNYYERLSEMNPGELADGLAMEQEFDAIGRGFAKLPEPHRDGKGFEGPTRVGDPVEETDAVNLGTLEKLNLPIYRKKITTEDWNTITDAGIYDVVNASGANKAPGYPYGVLVVHVFNGVATQLFYPDKNCSLIKRVCQSVSAQTWTYWDASYSSSMGAAGFRNKVINGNFSVNQRSYASGAATAANQYIFDRWKVSGPGGVTFVAANGKTTVTIPAGQTLKQVIEGVNLPAGDYVLSWGGTAKGRINNGEFGSSGLVSVTMAGGVDAVIEFSAGTLELVQFECGLIPQPFEARPYTTEQLLCRRYYAKLGAGAAGSAGSVSMYSVSGGSVAGSVFIGAAMRAVPTLRVSVRGVTNQIRNTANNVLLMLSGSPSFYSHDITVSGVISGIIMPGASASTMYDFDLELDAEL